LVKDNAERLSTVAPASTNPVLVVGLGRGGTGKSTMLAELVWRAQTQGRDVIVADGDPRSKTLSALFPDALVPASEELPDIKAFLSGLLNRMVKDKRSAVLDLGGGDRALMEFGRDLKLVEFCDRRGIDPLALYCLGPDKEDFAHVMSVYDGGYFRPKRSLLVFNEGVIRAGQTVVGAFEETMADHRLTRMLKDGGASPILLPRLASMSAVKATPRGFYAEVASGALDPVEEFMLEDWLAALESKRASAGVSGWLP
jgi:hypothetical protein